MNVLWGRELWLGTNFFEIDRHKLAKDLGFKKPTENSLDSVSDRDFVIEFLSMLSILSLHFFPDCQRIL